MRSRVLVVATLAVTATIAVTGCGSTAPSEATTSDTFPYDELHALCNQVISETLDDSFSAVLLFQIDGQFVDDESLTDVQVFGDESLLNDPTATSCGAVSTDEPEILRATVLVKLPDHFYVRVGKIP